MAGKRSIPSHIELPDAEIRFLKYRLEVVESWPDSIRKQVTREGILSRLNGNA